MGVKDLWQILAPICERKSLWELQDKTLAVDLSGWVCDSQNVAEFSTQPKMYLRNLFFRTSCLLLLGARPVFVLEGTAPDMKLNVMAHRNAARGLSQASQSTKIKKPGSGSRRRYHSIQKQCQEMLECMGVHCVQSVGEAEAFCALLNEKGVVDGCITQDSDCFLYGGRVIYRNFTISASSGGGGGPGFSVDLYQMDQVERALGLTRTKLVGLSLLCGCDYNQAGVAGVGKETALKFILTLSDGEIFSRFCRWRNDPFYDRLEKERTVGTCDECGHLGKRKQHEKEGCNNCGMPRGCVQTFVHDGLSQKSPDQRKILISELNIRKKALQDPAFPCQDMIEEFLCTKEKIPDKLQCQWEQPNLIKFMKLAERQLCWEESYSLEKFLPLLTRWVLLHHQQGIAKSPIFPERIMKERVLKGIASYEIKWTDSAGLFETLLPDTEDSGNLRTTVEPKELVQKAFPVLIHTYEEEKNAKKQAKKKGKARSVKITKVPAGKCENCGKEKKLKKQKCMCNFIKISTECEEKTEKPKSLEELLDDLIIGSVKNGEVRSSSPIEPRKGNITKPGLQPKRRKPLPQGDRPYECNVEMSNRCFQNIENSTKRKFPAEAEGDTTVKPTKLSFEDLLSGEKISEADFVSDEEMDLSDIVQSIIGNGLKSLRCNNPPKKGKADNARCTEVYLDKVKLGVDISGWETPQRSESSSASLPLMSGGEKSEQSSSAIASNTVRVSHTETEGDSSTSSLDEVPCSPEPSCIEDKYCYNKTLISDMRVEAIELRESSDEDVPYTPLIDRIKVLRSENVKSVRRPSILSSVQARRFSESFDLFCTEYAVTSSPREFSEQTSDSSFDLPPNYVENARGKFSLGVSDLLESSKQ